MVTYIDLIYTYSCIFLHISLALVFILLTICLPFLPVFYSHQTAELLIIWVHPYFVFRGNTLVTYPCQSGKSNSLTMGLMWPKFAIKQTRCKVSSSLKYCKILLFVVFFDKSTALFSKMNFVDVDDNKVLNVKGLTTTGCTHNLPNMPCDFCVSCFCSITFYSL